MEQARRQIPHPHRDIRLAHRGLFRHIWLLLGATTAFPAVAIGTTRGNVSHRRCPLPAIAEADAGK